MPDFTVALEQRIFQKYFDFSGDDFFQVTWFGNRHRNLRSIPSILATSPIRQRTQRCCTIVFPDSFRHRGQRNHRLNSSHTVASCLVSLCRTFANTSTTPSILATCRNYLCCKSQFQTRSRHRGCSILQCPAKGAHIRARGSLRQCRKFSYRKTIQTSQAMRGIQCCCK